jgi:hypothetical protein
MQRSFGDESTDNRHIRAERNSNCQRSVIINYVDFRRKYTAYRRHQYIDTSERNEQR